MAYEVLDEQGVRGPYTTTELERLLVAGAGKLRVRVVGTATWHGPSQFAELRRCLPTNRPPPLDNGSFSPVAPMKTVAHVRAPHAAPHLCAAVRQR